MLKIDIKKETPYTSTQIMSLVSDVANYKDFISFIKAIKIWDKVSENDFKAELLIGFKAFRIPFATHVIIDEKNTKVTTKLAKLPSKGLFDFSNQMKSLDCNWQIIEKPDGCEINLRVDFEFKDAIIEAIAKSNLEKAKNRLMELFLKEADRRFARV